MDLDEKLLRETEEAVKELVAFSGQEFEVTAHIDYKEALPGTDYLFNTIATGGYERWKSDIEVSTKHGVLQSVGDTIGPGGIIRALRTIPVILDVAKTMEEICPDAWIINYANPEGAICLALQKYTKIKNFGLCHGTPDMAKQLAEEVFKVPIERFTYRAAGINHLTWFTDMKIDGKDVYPKLHDKLKESGFDKKEPISKQLYDIYGLYPAPGDRHVGEFFPYYMKEEVLMEQDYEWKNNDFKVVDGWREEARVLFDEVRTKKEARIISNLLKSSPFSNSASFNIFIAFGVARTAIIVVVTTPTEATTVNMVGEERYNCLPTLFEILTFCMIFSFRFVLLHSV